jgi:hypothetical protein
MVNMPIGDIAALRLVTTGKYVSGWIDRIVTKPGDFPAPTAPSYTASAPANCGAYYCDRGDVAAAPVQNVVKGSNLERFASARAILLVKPSDSLSITATGCIRTSAPTATTTSRSNPAVSRSTSPTINKSPITTTSGWRA